MEQGGFGVLFKRPYYEQEQNFAKRLPRHFI